MNKEPVSLAPALNPAKFLVLLAVVILLVFAYQGWQNSRQTKSVNNLPVSELKPTPTFTASGSATPKREGLAAVTEPSRTTKGGQVLSEKETTQTTPTPQPSPTPSPTPRLSNLNKIYLDSQFSYRVRFSDEWSFRRTHGTNARDDGDILSRVELNKDSSGAPRAQVVILVRRIDGQSNLESWLKNLRDDLNFARGTKLSFAGVSAIIFTDQRAHQTESLYFIHGAYGYQINAWEEGPLSTQTLAIRDSFQP